MLVRDAAIMTNYQRPPLSKPEARALIRGGQNARHILEIGLWVAAINGEHIYLDQDTVEILNWCV